MNKETEEVEDWEKELKYQLARGGCNLLFEPISEIFISHSQKLVSELKENIREHQWKSTQTNYENHNASLDDIINNINSN